MLTDPRRARLAVTTAAALTAATTITATIAATLAAAAPASAATTLDVDTTDLPAQVVVDYSDVPDAALTVSSTRGQAALTVSGLPSGIGLTRTVEDDETVTWEFAAVAVAPGSYPVKLTVSDGAATQQVSTTVLVTPEDLTVTYTGPTEATGDSFEDEDVPVTFSAKVAQTDASPGDLTRATVTFTDDSLEEDLCTATVTAAGTASCTYVVDTSVIDDITYAIGADAGGWYEGGTATSARLHVRLPDEVEDENAPQTKITSGPGGWWMKDTATFGFSSSESGSDFWCRLDKEDVDCAGSSVTVDGLKPGTHRFAVSAEDADGNEDDTPAVSMFAVPFDDSALGGKGWKTKKSGAAYGGSYREAHKKGATLTYQVSGARELALLVTGKGKVQVFLGSKSLGVVKAGKGGKAAKLLSSAQPVSGVLKVVSLSAKKVGVDGLGVSTAAF